jgi:hypothetical protein
MTKTTLICRVDCVILLNHFNRMICSYPLLRPYLAMSTVLCRLFSPILPYLSTLMVTYSCLGLIDPWEGWRGMRHVPTLFPASKIEDLEALGRWLSSLNFLPSDYRLASLPHLHSTHYARSSTISQSSSSVTPLSHINR